VFGSVVGAGVGSGRAKVTVKVMATSGLPGLVNRPDAIDDDRRLHAQRGRPLQLGTCLVVHDGRRKGGRADLDVPTIRMTTTPTSTV
jgi:hypothetical protein